MLRDWSELAGETREQLAAAEPCTATRHACCAAQLSPGFKPQGTFTMLSDTRGDLHDGVFQSVARLYLFFVYSDILAKYMVKYAAMSKPDGRMDIDRWTGR